MSCVETSSHCGSHCCIDDRYDMSDSASALIRIAQQIIAKIVSDTVSLADTIWAKIWQRICHMFILKLKGKGYKYDVQRELQLENLHIYYDISL